MAYPLFTGWSNALIAAKVHSLEDTMATRWEEAWVEIWSAGHGRERSYCGIAETDEGFAVDVFQGDTCVASSTFASRADAERAAGQMRSRYQRVPVAYAPQQGQAPTAARAS